MWVLFLLLVIIFLKAVWLYRVYHLLPLAELKRRARTGDRRSSAIHRVVAQGGALDLILIIFAATSGTAVLVWASRFAWWGGALAVLSSAWIIFWLPRPKVGGWSWNLTAFESQHGLFFKRLYFLVPVFNKLAGWLPAASFPQIHSGVYEKEDLLNLLSNQNKQVDSRIPGIDLKVAAGALTFGDKKVADCMAPRRQLRFVEAGETAGPMLMDELHKTGFARFPVTKELVGKKAEPEVIGVLALSDLLDNLEHGGKVADIMHGKAVYINQTCTLHQALDAISKSRQHLLLVVNNFEEIVGAITLDNILEQILGPQMVDDFDGYGNLRAVAELCADKDRNQHHTVEPLSKPAEKK